MLRHRLAVIALVLGAGVLFVSLAAPYGLHQNDEDHYLGVAASMVERADMVVPYWGGRPTFTKPPLLYWAMAASMRLLGPTLFAARIPVALLSLLTIAGVYAFGVRLFGSRDRAALAAMLTASTIGFFQFGRVAMMEMPLTFLLLTAAWSSWRMGQGSGIACYGFAVAAAAGVMLKGPAAALVPLLGAALWLGLGRRHDPAARPLAAGHLAGGAALFVALVGAWPLALYMRGLYPTFHEQFIVGENLGKFNGTRSPLTNMLGGFVALLAPWTLLAVGAAWAWMRDRSQRRTPSVLLLLAFVAANLIVYSLPAVKWARYLLPSIPLLALLIVQAGMASSREVSREEAEVASADASASPDVDLASADGAMGVFSPLAVARPVKIGSVITGIILMSTVPFFAFGSRLLTETETRLEVLVLTLALALTALCLLHGARLFGAAASFAVALLTVGALAPAFTLDRPPSEAAAFVRAGDLLTYGVPPYRYQLLFDRPVDVCSEPETFREHARRGATFIVGDTELRDLMRSGAFNPDKAEMLISWTKWRRGMNPVLVAQVVVAGSFDDLTERVWIMRVRP